MPWECTHFTAETSNTHSVAQRPHWMHLSGSICQRVSPVFSRPERKPAAEPKPNNHTPRTPLLKRSRRLRLDGFLGMGSVLGFHDADFAADHVEHEDAALWVDGGVDAGAE